MKQAGLAHPEPTKTSLENWTGPCVIKGHLVAAFRGQEKFRKTYLEWRGEVRKRKRNVMRS